MSQHLEGWSAGRVVHVNDRVPGATYIGRGVFRGQRGGAGAGIPASRFGNPFVIGRHGDRATVLRRYREYLEQRVATEPEFALHVALLDGAILACWCRHDREERTPANECHGDVLLEVAARIAGSVR